MTIHRRRTARPRCVAGTLGGEARVALVADVSLPIVGKPFVCFGNATTSIPVAGTPLMAGTEAFMSVEPQQEAAAEREPAEATA